MHGSGCPHPQASARDRHRRRRPRSGLRGAGRGEAASGGIEPGDRSEGPGGRPNLLTKGADDDGPSSTTVEDDRQAKGIENSPGQGRQRRRVGGVGCDDGKSEGRGSFRWRRAKRGGNKPSAGRRADAPRMEGRGRKGRAGERPATAHQRRAGGETRPGGARRDGGDGSASGAGAKLRAAKRDTGHGVKGGPIPRRNEGPALAGGRRAAVTLRCSLPEYRAAGLCRPGSR